MDKLRSSVAATIVSPNRLDAPALGERYEILRELGSGGMGRVFQARDRETGEMLALKLLRPSVIGPEIIYGYRVEQIQTALQALGYSYRSALPHAPTLKNDSASMSIPN